MICMFSLVFVHTLISSLFFFKCVPTGVLCGRPEWEQVQTSLGPTYQLRIISRDFFNVVIYEGPHKAENKLYVYHAENHYSVITSMPAFVERNHYCHNCHVGYNPRGHICKQDACAVTLRWLACLKSGSRVRPVGGTSCPTRVARLT